MSASWFLLSTYLIWILESRLIRSNNQSRATLWVLETCLIVGLLPLIIILITASLSSNTYNKASWRADWTFERTTSMSFITSIFLWDLWFLRSSLSGFPDRSETQEIFPRTETNRSDSSRAGKPSNLSPVSNEMISDSVELWETAVCFLHIQLIGTKCMTSKNAQCSLEKWIWNLQDLLRKSESWNKSQSALFSSIIHHDNIVCIHKYDEYLKSIDSGVCHRPWSILLWIVRAYLLTIDYLVLPIRAKYKHFSTLWEHTCDNSPTGFVSSSLKWWSSMHGVDTL